MQLTDPLASDELDNLHTALVSATAALQPYSPDTPLPNSPSKLRQLAIGWYKRDLLPRDRQKLLSASDTIWLSRAGFTVVGGLVGFCHVKIARQEQSATLYSLIRVALNARTSKRVNCEHGRVRTFGHAQYSTSNVTRALICESASNC